MNQIIYIGVDDTDTLDSVGTGRVARGLAKYLVERGLATSLGVSRHQLLVNPQIKYTSHNSSKGLAVVTDRPEADFYQPAADYMRSIFVKGSDPGLCICPENKVNQEIIDYAFASQNKVLKKEESIKLAAKYNIFLQELGGDGGGIIGALAAVGLRASGNDGRLVESRGCGDVKGVLTVAQLLERTDIDSVQDIYSRKLDGTAVIDSMDRIKPALLGGKAVLQVRPLFDVSGKQVWKPIDVKYHKKKDKKAEPKEEKDDE